MILIHGTVIANIINVLMGHENSHWNIHIQIYV